MSMVIKTNMDAMRTLNLMTANQSAAQKYLEKVSTGMKIRNAQDDASAYAISEHMRVRIRALDQAHANTQNGSNMLKTAETAVANIVDAIKTLKEKAIDSANDSNTDEDRLLIQKEFNQFVDAIDDNALITFNNKYLIDGTRNNAFVPAKTILLNQRLSAATTVDTALTDLKNRADEGLGIRETDYYQVSWVMDGKLSEASGRVGNKTLTDILQINNVSDLQATTDGLITGITDKFGKDVYTPDKSQGLVISSLANADGSDALDNQITGFTISITDADGNVKKSVNSVLDQFNQYQRAETQTGDQALSFHVGADSNFATKFALMDMRAAALGLKGSDGNILSISTKNDANAAINVLDNVLQKVLDQQSIIGAALSRLERTSANLTTMITDDQSSESTIRDADMAKEMTNYTKYSLLTQTSQAMLAQANQNPNNALYLLGENETE
ncbi:MAG: flagellin [Selenomonadaceae bacterium]|nr:flagellin [Selenomonadaceae bacterium]